MWQHENIFKKEAFYQKMFNTITPHGLNDVENISKNTFDFPFKIPYGTGGLECLNIYQNTNIVSSGHKNLTRIFHHQKFK